MAVKTVNNSTLTEVLDGAGFCYSLSDINYYFGADAATAETEGPLTINGKNQMNGITGKKMWAKSISSATASITAISE